MRRTKRKKCPRRGATGKPATGHDGGWEGPWAAGVQSDRAAKTYC